MFLVNYHPGRAPVKPKPLRRGANWFQRKWHDWLVLTYQPRWWRWYRSYLKSGAWQTIRTAVLARDGYRCRGCGSTEWLQAHHRTYKHVGFEDCHLGDLVTLCKRCHDRQHGRFDDGFGAEIFSSKRL